MGIGHGHIKLVVKLLRITTMVSKVGRVKSKKEKSNNNYTNIQKPKDASQKSEVHSNHFLLSPFVKKHSSFRQVLSASLTIWRSRKDRPHRPIYNFSVHKLD